MVVARHGFVLPLSEICPETARQDAFEVVSQSAGAPTAYACHEAYCINPTCSCAKVHLSLHPVDGSAVAASPPRFLLDLKTGELEPESKSDSPQLESQLIEPLHAALTEDRIARLRAHHGHVSTWRKENWFLYQDWSDLELERMIARDEVYPSAQPFVFAHESREYIVDDQYCVDPGCRCRSLVLSFHETDPRSRRAPHVGAVLLARPQGSHRFHVKEVRDGKPEVVTQLIRSLQAARPTLQAELRQRWQEMRDFGRWVGLQRENAALKEKLRQAKEILREEETGKLGQAQAAERLSALLDGSELRPLHLAGPRNGPCICGSGRKLKNCCGR